MIKKEVEPMSTYYVRSRGKLAGPFNVAALQQMVKRGRLQRFDQVSADKTAWRSAGEMSELFAAASTRPTNAAATAVEDADEGAYDVAVGQGHSRTADRGGGGHTEFFYAQNGIAVGPVTLAVLQMLATNGTLRADDQVWADGSEIATPARQVPMLASLYSSGRVLHGTPVQPIGVRTSAAMPLLDETSALQAIAPTERRSTIFYLIAASLTLFFTMMPVALFHGHAFWWWDANGWWFASNVYTLVTAIGMLILAPLASGSARAIPIFVLTAAPLCVAFVVMMNHSGGIAGDQPIIATLALWGIFAFSVLQLSTNYIRPRLADGGPTGTRVVQIVCGSFLTLSAVFGVVWLIMAGEELPTQSGGPVLEFVLACVGVLGALAAGILAIVSGALRPFRFGLTLASTICAWCGAVLLICLAGAGFYMLLGSLLDPLIGAKSEGPKIYVCGRLAVLAVATIGLIGVSLNELLLWLNRRYVADAQ